MVSKILMVISFALISLWAFGLTIIPLFILGFAAAGAAIALAFSW